MACVLASAGIAGAGSDAESRAPTVVPPLRAGDLAASARVIFAGTVRAIEPSQTVNAGRAKRVQAIEPGPAGRTRRVWFRDIRAIGLPEGMQEVSLTVSDAPIGHDGSGRPVAFTLGARYVVFADSLLDDPSYLVMSWHGEPVGVFRVDLAANDSARFVRGLDGRWVARMGKDFIISGNAPLIDADSSVARLTEERILEARGQRARSTTPGEIASIAGNRLDHVAARSTPMTESDFLSLMARWRGESTRNTPTAH